MPARLDSDPRHFSSMSASAAKARESPEICSAVRPPGSAHGGVSAARAAPSTAGSMPLCGIADQGTPAARAAWFSPSAISLSVAIGVMMVCYVAVPSRLIGVTPTSSRRDKLAASAVGGALGAVVCTPPYLLARGGILMLGVPALLIPGIVVLSVGVTLQASATGAVKTIKMSAKLVTPGHHKREDTTNEPPVEGSSSS